jgi:hypothetical protein
MILDAEQKEISERSRRFTGPTPKDSDFHSELLFDCLLEDCIDSSLADCEAALIETWRPNVSLQEWFELTKKFIRTQKSSL